jgi:hypothetical protein
MLANYVPPFLHSGASCSLHGGRERVSLGQFSRQDLKRMEAGAPISQSELRLRVASNDRCSRTAFG